MFHIAKRRQRPNAGARSLAQVLGALAAAAVVLLAATTVPVVAAPSSGGEEFSAALEKAVQEEEQQTAEREEEIASPSAEGEREASRDAYGGLSAAQAQSLLIEAFPQVLKELNADPARTLSDLEVEESLGEYGARVVGQDGSGELLESPIPVEVAQPGQGDEPVNLVLEPEGTGFAPENPLTDVRLPGVANGSIDLEGGVAVDGLPGAGNSAAMTFGDKSLFFPETDTETDSLVAPVTDGVEIFEQLRSPESPERFDYALSLPAGAELRSKGDGAEVVDAEGEAIEVIPPPSTVDAQGSAVPTTLTVEGDTIAVEVRHRASEVAYPLLLDPILEDGTRWNEGANPAALSVWTWNESAGAGYLGTKSSCVYMCWGPGLYARSRGESWTYGANTWGQWEYTAPNTTSFISAAIFKPVNGEYHNCFTAQPHGYVGIYNVYTGYSGNGAIGIYSPPAILNGTYETGWIGAAGTRKAVVGIGTGNMSSALKCGHDFFSGGTTIWLDDPEAPTVNSVTGVPSGWVSDTTAFTINVTSSDPGLGVRFQTISPEGAPVIQDQVGCGGTRVSPCPESRSHAFNLNGNYFDQGVKSVTVTAEDPIGSWHVSPAYKFETKVDRTPPEVALSGQLAEATKEELAFGEGEKPQAEGNDKLRLPVYNLKVEARDGSNATKAQMRSGVKNIEVFLDKKTTAESVPWSAQSCPLSSCEMKQTYTLKLDGLEAGTHTLRVVAVDQVGKKLERKIEFQYIPATGISDEYVLQRFPLPSGEGNEAEEENPKRPELAVNVMNGNLVYRERDIEVSGPGANLEVERFYNSQLPSGENTEWGDGWTLAQTPKLTPKAGSTSEATYTESSGGIKDGVKLPTQVGQTTFSPTLQASVTKLSSGYKLSDETGEKAPVVAFTEAGKTEEERFGSYAKLKYTYAGGNLSGIAVKDPASARRAWTEPKPVPPVPTYTSSFGSPGSGNGQFSHPAGIAIDTLGNIWVADEFNFRIQKFNPSGEYLMSFGSQGSENGKFARPTDIAIDAKGNLWVTDALNHRVEKFNEKGEFLLKAGSSGTGTLQFDQPEAIAVDAKGNILVADTYNHRIQVLNEKGEFIRSFGSWGTGSGQLIEATGVASGPGNTVWVVDSHNNRVSVFSETGAFIKQFGSGGTGPGQFSRPDTIDIDTRGDVWVSDEGSHRIQEFNQNGEYITQFGSNGTGTGQFSLSWPTGMATDSKGRMWVSDPGNNRIQRWQIPNYTPTYTSSFGSPGSGNGQFSHPAGLAIDALGNLWVADEVNFRIQKFSASGEYLMSFGSQGSENGKFARPTDIAVDPQGNLWITDALNHRVEKFNENGEFLLKVGSSGTGTLQFDQPEAIAVDAKGNVVIADTYNHRIQVVNENGEFIRSFGSWGTGPGQMIEVTGLAIGPGNTVWAADSHNNRISVFSETGPFIRQFGSGGSGNGQFLHPDAIVADSRGSVFVADEGNNRIQQFNKEGEYVTQFGAKGTGAGQVSFSWPLGIATDLRGNLFVADPGNNRIQRWYDATYVSPAEEGNDPAVEIASTSGLVSKVEGPEAGTNTYAYTGDDLIGHKGPSGEAKYTYDAAGRMTKVELPNGTYGTITYNSTYGRVSSVTVDPAGSEPAKTTYFSYSDEPRRTTVTPEGAPVITYDIGADGSVLKWWNAAEPPKFNDLSGSLYANKETASPIPTGDHNLAIEAYSPEGISSIQVIVNGNQIVHENTCKQDYETPGTECVNVAGEWVINTDNVSPGILYVEAVITDRLGQSESRRFWVDIPQPPPPPAPGSPIAPTFNQVLEFREEYGLDVVDPVANELERNDRIFNLIDQWWAGDSTARATAERWGVPLRTRDVEELEYRERYRAQDEPLIQQWASSHAAGTYAGSYIDQRQGGIIHVGFTTNQSATVTALKQELPLIASDRVQSFEVTPAHALGSLYAVRQDFNNRMSARADLNVLLTTGHVDVRTNAFVIGATNPGPINAFVTETYGGGSGINVVSDPNKPRMQLTFLEEGVRARLIDNRLYAGDWIRSGPKDGGCTLAFGAWEDAGTAPSGQRLFNDYGLTAGHCWPIGTPVYHGGYKIKEGRRVEDERRIGTVQRRSNGLSTSGGFQVDSEAIRLNEITELPRWIYWSAGYQSQVNGEAKWHPGETLCYSGAWGGTHCGTAPTLSEGWYAGESKPRIEIELKAYSECGGSGSPVWNPVSGSAVAILIGGIDQTYCRTSKHGPTYLTPLLSVEGNSYVTEGGEFRPEVPPGASPGALAAPSMNSPHQLHIVDPVP